MSVAQRLWASDDTLVFLSDEGVGYYNPWLYSPSVSSQPLPILKSPLQEDFADMMRVRVLFSTDYIRSLRVSFLFELFVPSAFVWFHQSSLLFQP